MATVEFLIDEHGTWVDYAPHVVWSSVSFTAKVNGSVGDCSFQILDRAHVVPAGGVLLHAAPLPVTAGEESLA